MPDMIAKSYAVYHVIIHYSLLFGQNRHVQHARSSVVHHSLMPALD